SRAGGITMLAETSGKATWHTAEHGQLYFSDADGIKRVPLSGGVVQRITPLAPYTFEVNGDSILAADFGAGKVSTVRIADGEVSEVPAPPGYPLYPVRCELQWCWLNMGPAQNTQLLRLNADGTTKVLAQGLAQPMTLAFDTINFYIPEHAGGFVLV